jgi:hypothetical protein
MVGLKEGSSRITLNAFRVSSRQWSFTSRGQLSATLFRFPATTCNDPAQSGSAHLGPRFVRSIDLHTSISRASSRGLISTPPFPSRFVGCFDQYTAIRAWSEARPLNNSHKNVGIVRAVRGGVLRLASFTASLPSKASQPQRDPTKRHGQKSLAI